MYKILYPDGAISYRNNEGELHRENGPAVMNWGEWGTNYWYLHNQLHRINGPAIEYGNGDQMWCIHDNLHREDGPAVIFTNRIEWHLYGTRIPCKSQKEFEKYIKLKAFW